MVNAIAINDRKIGRGYPCFIIAEAGVNHNGSIEMARQLVDVAVEAKADAIKFQTFQAEALVTRNAPKAKYQLGTTDNNETQFEMLKKLELSPQAHQELQSYCKKRGILFMSTPFDEKSADFLHELGIPVFKIPSGELTNPFFLSHVARKKKPMIVSTGMADLEEVAAAVQAIQDAGNQKLVLLHCVSNYPADPADANLKVIITMEKEFNLLVGFSDHTPGIEVSLAAVALGACVIEKHFTLDRNLPGPDHKASLEPSELKTLVKGIRVVEQSLGHGHKEQRASEMNTANMARKSLVAARNISEGTSLTRNLIAIKRPGTGLPPVMFSQLIGLKAKQNISEGTLFNMDMFE